MDETGDKNNETPDYKVELEKCEKDREEYLNGWKRAKADLINYQKDEVKRLEEILKFATIEMIKDFIPVLDSFAAFEKDFKGEPRSDNLSERDLGGIHLIRLQLEDVLRKKGLEKIEVQPGDKFDPSMHEGIGEIESTHEAGSVAEQIERGYRLNGAVIRPARVKLAKQKV